MYFQISYEKQSLIQLMNKKVLVLAGSKRKDGETEDIQDYNYDNIRDATNYCPPVDGAPMDDHPDDGNFFYFIIMFPISEPRIANELFSIVVD